MMNKDELAKSVAPSLKVRGFRKKGRTWWRETPELFQLFNIQGSSWDKNEWYLNVGIFLKPLDGRTTPPAETGCHIRDRLPPHLLDPEEIVAAAVTWFEKHGSLSRLAALEREGNLRGLVWASARDLLRAQVG